MSKSMFTARSHRLSVEFSRPDRMNLLGYLLRSVFDRAAHEENTARQLRKLKGRIEIGASSMKVFVKADGERMLISTEADGKPEARVWGTLDALLDMATGGGFVGALLSGKVRIGGKAWRLLPLLSVFKGART